MKRFCLLLTVMSGIVALANCTNMKTRTLMLDESSHYAPTRQVQVLTKMPAEPHKIIANWQCSGCSGVIHYQCFKDLQTRAEQLGADALFIQQAGVFPCQGFCHCPYVLASALKFKKPESNPSK